MATISAYDSSSIGVLFSSINNGRNNATSLGSTDLLGINYSDYATIRSGSYHKLLKAYYSDATSDAVKDTISNSTSIAKDDTKTLTRIQSAAESMKDSAEALQNSGSKSVYEKVTTTDDKGVTTTDYDRNAIYKAVEQFSTDYNELLDKAADSNTTNILRAAKTMVNYSKVNERLLAKVGITIGKDNQLSVDKTVLDKADVSDIKSLFQSRGAYGYQIQTQASLIDSYAKTEATKANTYGNTGVYTYNYNTGELYNTFI